MSVLYVGQRVFCVSKGVFRVSMKVCWYECFVCQWQVHLNE